MELPAEVTDDLRKRLRRIAGQVQGIERMLDEGRECRDIVTQISAANRALEQSSPSCSASTWTSSADSLKPRIRKRVESEAVPL